MKKLGFILAFALPLSILACQKEAAGETADCIIDAPNIFIVCTADFNPVCGCDQKTYPNPCGAEAAGVKTFTTGKCP
jgi:hypothetical protein